MPSLVKLLKSYDIDMLTRIALSWGVEMTSLIARSVEEGLLKIMTDGSSLSETIDGLPKTTTKHGKVTRKIRANPME